MNTTLRSGIGTLAPFGGLLTFAPFALAACPGPVDHELRIGVQSEMLAGVTSVRITTTTPEGTSSDLVDFAKLPYDTRVQTTKNDAELSLRVEALDSANNPVVTRTARVTIPEAGVGEQLLRIRLTSLCQAPNTPSCTDGQTCIAGRCQDDRLLPSDLELFSPNWAVDIPDICRPANPGSPEVIVGTGQTDYLPLTMGQIVQLELGPQGGHHLYIALRQKNLHRSGSTTTITGKRVDMPVDVPSTAFVFTFDPDEGGYCKLYGLRYQLDSSGTDYRQFLDRDFDITVTVRDSSGTTGVGTTRVHISPTVIGM